MPIIFDEVTASVGPEPAAPTAPAAPAAERTSAADVQRLLEKLEARLHRLNPT